MADARWRELPRDLLTMPLATSHEVGVGSPSAATDYFDEITNWFPSRS